MAQYILRDLDGELWGRVRTKAEQDGWPMRALILQLLDDYASGRVRPSQAPPPRQAEAPAGPR